MLEAVTPSSPWHSSPKALPSLGEGAMSSGRRWPAGAAGCRSHLAETPASMAAATPGQWRPAAVLVLGHQDGAAIFGLTLGAWFVKINKKNSMV